MRLRPLILFAAIFTFFSALSAILFALSIVLWWRSDAHLDSFMTDVHPPSFKTDAMHPEIPRDANQEDWFPIVYEFDSYLGQLRLMRIHEPHGHFAWWEKRQSRLATLPVHSTQALAVRQVVTPATRLARVWQFGPCVFVAGIASQYFSYDKVETITVPWWSLALLTAVLPAIWSVRHFRIPLRAQVRRRAGQCLRCGYDLRATPDRCPECGTIPSGYKSVAN